MPTQIWESEEGSTMWLQQCEALLGEVLTKNGQSFLHEAVEEE